MVDPIITPTLLLSGALAAGAGAAGAAAGGLFSKKDSGPAPAPAAAPEPSAPAAAPATKKPQASGMQQSFLSGIAGSMLPGAGGGGGQTNKTLLGA